MLTTKQWWCILIMKDYSSIYNYLGNIILHKHLYKLHPGKKL